MQFPDAATGMDQTMDQTRQIVCRTGPNQDQNIGPVHDHHRYGSVQGRTAATLAAAAAAACGMGASLHEAAGLTVSSENSVN